MAEAAETGPRAEKMSTESDVIESAHFSPQSRMNLGIGWKNAAFLCDWRLSHPSSGGDDPFKQGALLMRASVEGNAYEDTLNTYIDRPSRRT